MNRFTRREFLGVGAAAAAAGAGIAAKKHLDTSGMHSREHANDHRTPHHDDPLEKEREAADIASALAVVAAFLKHVVWEGAVKESVTGTAGKSLGPSSAAQMIALEMARVIGLYHLGDEYAAMGAEAKHELYEGLKLIPVLVALSDFIKQGVDIDPDKLLRHDQLHHAIPARPSIEHPNLQHWEQHRQQLERKLLQSVADVTAVTSVLAPLGTTYASSATSDRMKKQVLELSYELAIAQQVTNDLRRDERAYLNKDQLEEEAMKTANELSRGSWGFSKLTLTLSSNIQGSWGIGDPPEIFAAMRHADKPKRLLKAHAFGIANSEAHTLEMCLLWLKKAGVTLTPSDTQTFIKQQQTVAASLLRAITRRDSESNASPVSLHGAEYLRIKRDAAQAYVTEKRADAHHVSDALASLYADPSSWLKNFLSPDASQKAPEIDAALKAVDESPGNYSSISALLHNEPPGQVQDPMMRMDAYARASIDDAKEALMHTFDGALSQNSQESTQSNAATDHAHSAEHSASFLSHSAQEVLWALSTQVPVVEPAAHLAAKATPRLCNIEDGKRPTAAQAKKAVATYLCAVIAMSAFADNAAAYLFGETSLEGFFTKYYGTDVFARHPILADLTTIAPLKIGEQAGSLTKVGNGPNFDQQEWVLERDQHGNMIVVVHEMSLQATFQNRFAQLANAQLFMTSMAAFSKIIDELYV